MRNLVKAWLFALGIVFAAAAVAQPQAGTGTIIVLNKSGDDASFIDLASGELLATLPTGRGPHELTLTSDGRWAIGTDYSGGNSLTVFDVENLGVERTIDLSAYPRPHGILLLPGEEQVLVTSEGSRQLVIVDFHRGEVVRSIDISPHAAHMVALSEDGSLAFTSNGATNAVGVVDVVSGQLLKTLAVPARPEAITTNRAGTEVWVGSNDEHVVTVLSVEDGSVLAQWSGFEWPYRILLTRDERYAVIPDLGNERLRLFRADTRTELGALSLAGMQPQGVTLLPDDRTLLLSLSGRNRIVAIDIGSFRMLREYDTGEAPDGIVFSPLRLRKIVDYQQ